MTCLAKGMKQDHGSIEKAKYQDDDHCTPEDSYLQP